jgi:hypothetical protein
MSGGFAKTHYSRDDGATWATGDTVTYRVWKRGGGSGVHTLLYRSTDAAGNLETPPNNCEVKIDARRPQTTDDAPPAPQIHDVTVHFSATDSLVGVTACSGVKETWYSVDGGDWQEGTSVMVTAAGNEGLHRIACYSVGNAGNAEYVRGCGVLITGIEPVRRASRLHPRHLGVGSSRRGRAVGRHVPAERRGPSGENGLESRFESTWAHQRSSGIAPLRPSAQPSGCSRSATQSWAAGWD